MMNNTKNQKVQKMNQIDIYLKAIRFYGPENQIMVFLGELAELSQALETGDTEAIAEEIADVQICLAQRFLIAGVEPDFSKSPQVTGSLEHLFSEAVLQEARCIQGRGWNALACYMIESWIKNKIEEFQCAEEVEAWKIKKLNRLAGRFAGYGVA